jgi:ASC-1-like (ASCH) protein
MNHLAIMRQPYLQYIQDGKKTIESRATKVKCAPFGKVHKGDTVFFKQSGDQWVRLQARVVRVEYYTSFIPLTMQHYKTEIGIDEEYIMSKHDAKFLTLIWLDKIKELRQKCFSFHQKGRQAWFPNFKPATWHANETKICPRCGLPLIYERIPTIQNPKKVDWCCENIDCGYRAEARWRPEAVN